MRSEADGRAVFGNRLPQLPIGGQDDTEAEVGRGAIRLEASRLTAFGDRLLDLPLFSQGEAETGVGHGEVGLEADRRAEFGNTSIEIVLDPIQGIAQLVASLGILRVEAELLV